MKKKYILGIIISVALITLNQAVIQYALNTIKQDAKQINIAGRQRMLSQKVNLEFYQLNSGLIKPEQLKETFKTAKNAHFGLISGSKELSLKRIKSNEIKIILRELTALYSKTETYINEAASGISVDIEAVNQNQNLILVKMDGIVNSLEDYSIKKLWVIIFLEIILALFSIIVIALEVKYIYYPQALKLKLSNEKIQSQHQTLKDIGWQQSHEVRKPVANILGICNLIKTDPTLTDLERNELLNHLEESSKELDLIIKKIVDQSYQTRHPE